MQLVEKVLIQNHVRIKCKYKYEIFSIIFRIPFIMYKKNDRKKRVLNLKISLLSISIDAGWKKNSHLESCKNLQQIKNICNNFSHFLLIMFAKVRVESIESINIPFIHIQRSTMKKKILIQNHVRFYSRQRSLMYLIIFPIPCLLCLKKL